MSEEIGSVQQQQTARPAGVRLSDTDDAQRYCEEWLAQVCEKQPGIVSALAILNAPDGGMDTISTTWPRPNLDLADLSKAAALAAKDRKTVVSFGRTGPDKDAVQAVGLLIALPIGSDGHPIGAVAVALSATRGAANIAPEAVADHLRWATGWIDKLYWARRAKSVPISTRKTAVAVEMLATVNKHSKLRDAGTELVNHLISQLHCDRAAVGILNSRGAMRLLAISRSASFKKRSDVADALENAMEEAADQETAIAIPPLPATRQAIALANRNLAELSNSPHASVLSVRLLNTQGLPFGAMTLERHDGPDFDGDAVEMAQAVAAAVGPTIALHLKSRRFVAGLIVDYPIAFLQALFGPRRPALKLGAVAALALLGWLAFADGEHRVTAKSVLEGEIQRAAVAPFDGFILASAVRAGDRVKAGDVLARLDDRDLKLDVLKWQSERDKLEQKQREALAKHDRSAIMLATAQIKQAEAELGLAKEKLSKTSVRAPFDGIVVSGDLSQMLGSPIEKGKLLFEVAPLDSYRLILQVDDRDARYVTVGERGTLVLAGMPTEPVPFGITRVTSVTNADDGRNYFRIEARLDQATASLRPGMEGIAKVDAGQRSLVWIWSHTAIDWVRMVLWKYIV